MAETKFPPYVNAFNSIPTLFHKIREAAVPTKFTNDYLSTILGLKSSSHRALIPLLKRVEFLDAGGSPTNSYKDFRGEKGKSSILAEKVKKAYDSLYKNNEFAHTLDKKAVENIIVTVTGASKNEQQVPAVANTFLEFVKLANFDSSDSQELPHNNKEEDAPYKKDADKGNGREIGLGLSYTINLNLPPTTEIEVFNAIFKSLKEHLLDK